MIEVYESSNGEWRWRVKGKNGEKVASGEAHADRWAALRAVTTLMTLLGDPEVQIHTMPFDSRLMPRKVTDNPQA